MAVVNSRSGLAGPAARAERHGIAFGARCTGCGACLLTCPTHAIRPVGGRLTALDTRCTGCGECVEVCPVDAIDLAVDGWDR